MTSGLSGRGPGGPVLIKGAGDIATGIACRLWAAGFSLVMTDLPQPTAIRRTVAFASAVYHGEFTVEGITARHVRLSEVARVLDGDGVAVVTDDWATVCRELRPPVIVDAVLAKRNTGTFRGQAGLVIAVGPGFCAGQDVDLVVESQRGHWLGRVICSGRAADNTGVPGIIGGAGAERVLRASVTGVFRGLVDIGEMVRAGQTVAMVGSQPVQATIDGLVRGLLADGLTVVPNFKVGDIDPRGCREYCFTVSDKARAIGGGVLEAIVGTGGRRRVTGN